MATIVGGLGLSHSPTIVSGKLNNKANDPAWAPIFENFAEVKQWLVEKEVDAIFMIYNDHITSFFFDHYSMFAMGVDDEYQPADEGGGAIPIPPIPGHAGLARHIGEVMVSEEFDMSFFQKKGIDHGCFSPLSMIALDEDGWAQCPDRGADTPAFHAARSLPSIWDGPRLVACDAMGVGPGATTRLWPMGQELLSFEAFLLSH